MRQVFIIAVLLTSIPIFAQNTGTLTVVVKGCRSNNGIVMGSIFNSADGFPSDKEKAVQKGFSKINNKTGTIVFKNLPFGEYAVTLAHDENNNHTIDCNWIGIPKEGVGASNNGQPKTGPPKYENAKFKFKKSEQIVVNMVYIL